MIVPTRRNEKGGKLWCGQFDRTGLHTSIKIYLDRGALSASLVVVFRLLTTSDKERGTAAKQALVLAMRKEGSRPPTVLFRNKNVKCDC